MKKITAITIAIFFVASMVYSSGQKDESSEKWPTKEITFVYKSKAGSGGDIMLRNLGKALTNELGQPIVVENITGSSGYKAWSHVKKSAPDGYTFCGISSSFITSPLLNNMDILPEDFDVVSVLYEDPLIIYCRPDTWDSFDEFIKDAKDNPGKIKIGGGTPGSIDFTVFRMFEKETGVDISEVPFTGGGDATIAVVGKHLDIGIGEYAEVLPMVEAGKLKVLVSFNEIKDSGVKSMSDYGYSIPVRKIRGMLAPKGTPADIKEVLYNSIKKVSENDPDMLNYIKTNHLVPLLMNPEDSRKFLSEQREIIKSGM